MVSSLRRAARCQHCCAACSWRTWRPATCGCCCHRRRRRHHMVTAASRRRRLLPVAAAPEVTRVLHASCQRAGPQIGHVNLPMEHLTRMMSLSQCQTCRSLLLASALWRRPCSNPHTLLPGRYVQCQSPHRHAQAARAAAAAGGCRACWSAWWTTSCCSRPALPPPRLCCGVRCRVGHFASPCCLIALLASCPVRQNSIGTAHGNIEQYARLRIDCRAIAQALTCVGCCRL